MKKNAWKIFLLLMTCLYITNVYAQAKRHHVALLLPLYLDSAFDATDSYRYGKAFPKQSIPGLEFYMGAQFALDSLSSEGKQLTVHVLDYKSSGGSLNTLAASPLMDSIDLIIAPVTGSEYLQVAALAQKKNIPFISATYPNDGGIRNNPNVVIVNAKLNTHLQATYNYVMRNLGTSRIIYARRKNAADDKVAEIFKSLNQTPSGGSVMRMETTLLNDVVMPEDLLPRLDSNRENVIIAGSVDENFGKSLLAAAAEHSKSYAVTMVGMPTWEGIRDIYKPEYRNMPIIFSTSFYNTPGDAWSTSFDSAYRKTTYSKPSDVAYKGYEITWKFVNLLLKYDKELIKHLDDKSFNLLTEYDFRPIQWNKTDPAGPDYYENKRVYIIKRLNGITIRVN